MYLQPCPRCGKPDSSECPIPDWPQPPACDDCVQELASDNSTWCTVCQIAVENPEEGGEVNCACS